MFRQAKSAFIWYHLYKFRKTFTLIAVLLSIVLFSQWIYADIVQYLELRKHLEYLDIVLPAKWAIILFNISLSIYLFLSLFKKEKVKEKVNEKRKTEYEDNNTQRNTKPNEEKFSNREKEFLNKKKLNTKANNIINK